MEFQDTLAFYGNRTSAGVLVNPDLVSVFEELVSKRGVKMDLLVEDYSKLVHIFCYDINFMAGAILFLLALRILGLLYYGNK